MRRWILAALVVVATFGGVLVLPAAAAGAAAGEGSGDGSSVSVRRFGGADRYVTSLLVAEQVAAEAGGSLDAVVLVSGRRWTDAVVSAPLAGSLGAPVLMTPSGELRSDALEFLERVGVSSALVVGPDGGGEGHGPGRGVSDEVLVALEAAGITAERVAGDDRYGTGVAAAGQVTPGAMGELGSTAVIASGDVFADALVAGPFAARGIHPVLLSPPEELHADVAAYLGEADIKHVVLMGGTAALSDNVEQAIEDLGIDVTRVAGSTRYDTATKAAELAEDRYNDTAGRPCFANDVIGIARARVPFDSFSAAPLLGRLCAPLVLADPHHIPTDTADYLTTARNTHNTVSLHIFGGNAAISQTAIDAWRAEDDSPAACRLRTMHGLPHGTVGFPLRPWTESVSGTLRVAVLFMDFPNAQAAHTTREEIGQSLDWAEEYLEKTSYRKLDIEFVPHHAWLRAEQPFEEYLEGSSLFVRATEHAVALADAEFDFSRIDATMVVFSNIYFGGGNAGGHVTADETTMISSRINSQPWDSPIAHISFLGRIMAHELLHNLGFPDLYPYDAHTRPKASSGNVWVQADFGPLGLAGFYLAPHRDQQRRASWWRRSSGTLSSHTTYDTRLKSAEMAAWNRWLPGWLSDRQVRCITSDHDTVALAPIARTGGRIAMAAVPLNRHQLIVAESRRKIGFDRDSDSTTDNDTGAYGDWAATEVGLIDEGVLVYTVDTDTPGGGLPIRIAGDSGNGQVDGFPVLQAGESVTVAGWTITVTADDGDTHTVSITRD